MLRKQALKKLPLKTASRETVNLARRVYGVAYLVTGAVRIVEHQKVLVLDFYPVPALLTDDRRARYRMCIAKDHYLTMVLADTGHKWRTGTIFHCIEYPANTRPYMCADDATYYAILRFLGRGRTEDVFKDINTLQQELLAKKLQARHKQIMSSIDARMSAVPPLPPYFKRWCGQTALAKSRYLFYEYKRGRKAMDGYCTCCGHAVTVEKPGYNRQGVCPHCGKTVTFKTWKKVSMIWDTAQAALIQKTEAGIVVRYFELEKDYRAGRSPKLMIREQKRDFYEGGSVYRYTWDNFKQTGQFRWCERFTGRYTCPVLYEKNLKTCLAGTPWQYAGLFEYATRYEGAPVDVAMFLENFERFPFIEYLNKMGLYRLTADVIADAEYYRPHGRDYVLNYTGKTPQEILRIERSEIGLLKQLDPSISELASIQTAKAKGLALSLDFFRQLFAGYRPGFQRYVLDIMEYTTLHQILKYIGKQTEPDWTGNSRLQLWHDYLGFCRELGYDMKNTLVLFPKELKSAHDREYERYRKIQELQKRRELKQARRTQKKFFAALAARYNWENGEYIVTAPKSMLDIIGEGHRQANCVGSYAERAAAGDTLILFLRRRDKPDTPFYTIEAKNGEILQCEGYAHTPPTPEILETVEAYRKARLIQDTGMPPAA